MTGSSRAGLVVAATTTLLLILGAGALGIVGPGGPVDLLYVGAAVVALVGAVSVRLRPRGMTYAFAAAAGTVLAATAVVLALGLHRSPGVSLGDLLGLTVLFAGGYALAAWFCSRGPSLPAAGEGAH
ncbi:hypothetical protein BJF81_01900 [Ornithinimicrobium sp. CNJ-824]|uniref:hypothetical protein n=1 Tax=Ornithinimicrobium sp. CNJ-824 TaxID=1904966 RepID=UPI00095C7366|nr:hypothetical protein [Ornithinimicrobium sp. CNJ-824]OLT22557.1 hypothetical protein BJF81_01900 [Ornithinimicrobium sp. CNJ-824]